jgi:hypothetical protein
MPSGGAIVARADNQQQLPFPLTPATTTGTARPASMLLLLFTSLSAFEV